jgi:cytochrome P450
VSAAAAARAVRRRERRLYLSAHPLAYPLLAGIGRLGPVPGVGVVVNDADVARAVLGDTERFVKNGPGSSGALWTPVLGPSVLLNMEGPGHRELRTRLTGLFTPASAAALCERVLAERLTRLTEKLRGGATVDLVPVVQAAAGAVIGELIGFPGGDESGLFRQGEQIVSMVRLTTRELSAAQVVRAKRVLDEVVAPAAAAYRRGDPDTAMGRMAALGLSEPQALGAAAAFFLTGTETVATTVPRLIAMCCDHGFDAGLADDPVRLDAVIDEAMRVMAPTPAMLRRCVQATRVGGTEVRAGERVLIATLTCTRSAGPFDPEQPHRELRRLWFGAGPHYCIGAPLALAEIRALTRAVLAAAPLRIVRRRSARRVLIPAYRSLEVARA